MSTNQEENFRIEGAVALVTGGGTGIGAETARTLARAGAKAIILTARREDPLKNVKEEIEGSCGCEVHYTTGDVSDPIHVKNLFESAEKKYGQLDILVNNAGAFLPTDLSDEKVLSSWDKTFYVNTSGPFNLIHSFYPLLEKSKNPSVINISSTLAKKPIPGTSAYNASKAAINQMTRSLALDLAPKGIRVNCIMPAVVDTPMFRSRFEGSDAEEKGLKDAVAFHPLGRVGAPSDIANAVLFLASPASSWITGIELPVDGGMLCT